MELLFKEKIDKERFRLWVDSNPKIPGGKTYLEVWKEINKKKNLTDY